MSRSDYIAIVDDGIIEFLVKRTNQTNEQVFDDIARHQDNAQKANPDEWEWEDVKKSLIAAGYEIASCEEYIH